MNRWNRENINLLKKKWPKHNNPVLSDYYAEKEFSYETWMPFLQINLVWWNITATWVFINRKDHEKNEDLQLIQYLATIFSKELSLPLWKYTIFFIN